MHQLLQLKLLFQDCYEKDTVVPPNSRLIGSKKTLGISRLNNSSKPFQPKVNNMENSKMNSQSQKRKNSSQNDSNESISKKAREQKIQN